MPKSITTPSQNTQTNSQSSFKVGDAVLCPSIGSGTYMLHPNGGDKNSTRLIIRDDNHSHGFYRDGRISPNDALPLLFHDTPANRQAVNALFGTGIAAPLVIDTTKADDKEAVILSALDLSDIACDISGAIKVLNDIGQLLALIHYQKINIHTAISLCRLTHDACHTWADLMQLRLNNINEPLALTTFGTEGE